MGFFNVEYTEIVCHDWEIEADCFEQAEEEFEQRMNAGELDYSYGDTISSIISIRKDGSKKLSTNQLIELYFSEYISSHQLCDMMMWLGSLSYKLVEQYVLEKVDLKEVTEEQLQYCTFSLDELKAAYPHIFDEE